MRGADSQMTSFASNLVDSPSSWTLEVLKSTRSQGNGDGPHKQRKPAHSTQAAYLCDRIQLAQRSHVQTHCNNVRGWSSPYSNTVTARNGVYRGVACCRPGTPLCLAAVLAGSTRWTQWPGLGPGRCQGGALSPGDLASGIFSEGCARPSGPHQGDRRLRNHRRASGRTSSHPLPPSATHAAGSADMRK
jgi:hypothetical protein